MLHFFRDRMFFESVIWGWSVASNTSKHFEPIQQMESWPWSITATILILRLGHFRRLCSLLIFIVVHTATIATILTTTGTITTTVIGTVGNDTDPLIIIIKFRRTTSIIILLTGVMNFMNVRENRSGSKLVTSFPCWNLDWITAWWMISLDPPIEKN